MRTYQALGSYILRGQDLNDSVFINIKVYIEFVYLYEYFFFFFQAEDGIRDLTVTGVQTCALPISRDPNGLPDFKYVATHICDSVKRRLKADGAGLGLQGEFGIGLLSFWTVGDTLTMTSTSADERVYQMVMSKGDPRYVVKPRRVLFSERGTELKIRPLLEGIRGLSGEKIQWYLASELRDRIRNTQVRVTVLDKLARKQYQVEPRQFEGRLLHQLPTVRSPFGEAYGELYLTEPDEDCRVALTRDGTRVIADIGTLPGLERPPWSSRYLQGLIDVPYLNLTPGTRAGIVHDER